MKNRRSKHTRSKDLSLEHYLRTHITNLFSKWTPQPIKTFANNTMDNFIHLMTTTAKDLLPVYGDLPHEAIRNSAFYTGIFIKKITKLKQRLHQLSPEQLSDTLNQLQDLVGYTTLSPISYETALKELINHIQKNQLSDPLKKVVNRKLKMFRTLLIARSERTDMCLRADLMEAYHQKDLQKMVIILAYYKDVANAYTVLEMIKQLITIIEKQFSSNADEIVETLKLIARSIPPNKMAYDRHRAEKKLQQQSQAIVLKDDMKKSDQKSVIYRIFMQGKKIMESVRKNPGKAIMTGLLYQSTAAAALDPFIKVTQSIYDGFSHSNFGKRTNHIPGIPEGIKLSNSTGTLSSMSVASDGNKFGIAWQGTEIYVRFFNNDGASATNDIIANTVTSGPQVKSSIDCNGTDYFVIWESTGRGIFFQRYSASTFLPIGSETQIVGDPLAKNPALASNRDGWLFTWEDSSAIRALHYSVTGSWGSTNQVSGPGIAYYRPSLASNGNDYLIAYERRQTTSPDVKSLQMRTVSTTGAPISASEIQLASGDTSTGSGYFSKVATFYNNPNYFVVWSKQLPAVSVTAGIYGRQIINGNPGATTIQLNSNYPVTFTTYPPNIAFINNDGKYLAVWTSSNQGGSPEDAIGRRVTTDGQLYDNEFIINIPTSGLQAQPATTGFLSTDSKNAIVPWIGTGNNGQGIYATLYKKPIVTTGTTGSTGQPFFTTGQPSTRTVTTGVNNQATTGQSSATTLGDVTTGNSGTNSVVTSSSTSPSSTSGFVDLTGTTYSPIPSTGITGSTDNSATTNDASSNVIQTTLSTSEVQQSSAGKNPFSFFSGFVMASMLARDTVNTVYNLYKNIAR